VKQILLFFFAWLFAFTPLMAQTKVNIDSLTAAMLRYPKEDTVKLNMLINIAEAYYKKNPDSSITYAERSIVLAEQLQFPYQLANAYLALGSAFESIGATPEATVWLNKALPIFERLNKPLKVAKIYRHFGSLSTIQGDGQSARKYFLKAIDIVKATDDKIFLANLTSNLATTYILTNEFQEAVTALNETIAMYEAMNNKERVAAALTNLAGAHYYLGEYVKSIDCLQRALQFYEQNNNKRGALHAHVGLSQTYNALEEFEKAIYHAQKGLELNEIFKIKSTQAVLYQELGLTYNALSDADQAIFYLEKARKLLIETNDPIGAARNLDEIGKACFNQSQFSKAFRYSLEALKIFEDAGDVKFVSETKRRLGHDLLYMPDSALVNLGIDIKERLPVSMDYLNQSITGSRSLGMKEAEMQSLDLISKNYEMQGNYINAYDAYKKYIVIKDSISGDEVKKQITRKEIQYEFDKKETALKYQQQLTNEQLEQQRLLTIRNEQDLRLREQDLTLSNKEKDLARLAYLKEQAEKQEKVQALSLSEEREKGKERDLNLKNLELLVQQKQNFYLIALAVFLLAGLCALLYFYNMLKKQKNIIAQQNNLNEHTIAILSHDIKGPLMGVNLLLKKLNKDDPFVAQASQSLETQINAVNNILNNLLSMKKLALSPKDKNVSANVNAVLKNVLQELSIAIQTKGITIQNELTDNIALPISPEKLQIILINLVSNAVKYSFPNQSIRIYLEKKGVCIQDYGVGLSTEQRTKITREVTASREGTQQERGSGLGLFLVNAILQDESLKILFDSPSTGGTVVKLVHNAA
jgi:signal transduction histidine kinase/tetratricopeptide (TPR) repeat protein